MRIRTIAMAGLAAAAVAYLFDPTAGGARRSRIRERVIAFTRRRTIPEPMPPLPANVVSAPTDEAVAGIHDEPTKDEVADTPEPTREVVADAPEKPTKDEVAGIPDEPTQEVVADAPERPRDIADMPRERMRGYLADIREDRPMDDAAIASLVRTKVLGRPGLDTGRLVVDVVQGVAFLRGDLKDPRQVDEVVDLTSAVPGVLDVKNLIHLPESPTESRPTASPLGDAWNA